jgi:hypothetical protein
MRDQNSERNRKAKNLEKFDQEHDTLIDYFIIMGPKEELVRDLVTEILEGQSHKGYEYMSIEELREYIERVNSNQIEPHDSTGAYRVLFPSILC